MGKGQMIRGWLTSQRRTDRGATAVEFALLMVILLTLVFEIIQYGMYFYSMQTGTSAAREAVRRLSVGDCQNMSELKPFIHRRLGSHRRPQPSPR